MKIFAVVAIMAVLTAPARPAWADDLPLGDWTGFGLNLFGNNANRQPASLAIKKVPDPHVLWRGGSGELTSAVFQVQNVNNRFELGSISLTADALSFSFSHPDRQEPVSCMLRLQPKEGTYVGECLGRRITLMPPSPAPPKPAEAKPAAAK
jgi:hypothetical protein